MSSFTLEKKKDNLSDHLVSNSTLTLPCLWGSEADPQFHIGDYPKEELRVLFIFNNVYNLNFFILFISFLFYFGNL